MKKQVSSKSFLRKSIFTLGLISFIFASSVQASSTQDPADSPNSSIKYVGSLDGKPVFRVELNNLNSNVYFLTIKDDEGSVLYSEKIKDKQFSKSFKFETADRDNVKLTFTLSGENQSQSKEFKVNTNTRVLNDVVVTTL